MGALNGWCSGFKAPHPGCQAHWAFAGWATACRAEEPGANASAVFVIVTAHLVTIVGNRGSKLVLVARLKKHRHHSSSQTRTASLPPIAERATDAWCTSKSPNRTDALIFASVQLFSDSRTPVQFKMIKHNWQRLSKWCNCVVSLLRLWPIWLQVSLRIFAPKVLIYMAV